MKAKYKLSLAELKVAQANLGKPVAQCAETMYKAKRAEARDSITEKEAEISRLNVENKELKTFKLSVLDRTRELGGKVEVLIEEAA